MTTPHTRGRPVPLWYLEPGTKFILAGLESVRGVLVYANEARARVRTTSDPKLVSFKDREFWASTSKEGDWAPDTMVYVIREEDDG